MKLNKVLVNIDLPKDVKNYVNNYINESISLMRENGFIEEFIWGIGDDVINTLIENDIITYGIYNEDNILIPSTYKENITTYMLSDTVLLKNGFTYILNTDN